MVLLKLVILVTVANFCYCLLTSFDDFMDNEVIVGGIVLAIYFTSKIFELF